MVVQPLYGHVSAETAYLIPDYPYSFSLRCKKRVWLEFKGTQGVRLCSQTTNPKLAYEKWNAVKCSTYSTIAGCMYLDEKGHVHWSGLSEYGKAQEALDFICSFPGIDQQSRTRLHIWCSAKLKYTQRSIDTKTTPYGMLSDFEVEDRQKELEIWGRCVELLKNRV